MLLLLVVLALFVFNLLELFLADDGGVESLNGDCKMVTGDGERDDDKDNELLRLLVALANSN